MDTPRLIDTLPLFCMLSIKGFIDLKQKTIDDSFKTIRFDTSRSQIHVANE